MSDSSTNTNVKTPSRNRFYYSLFATVLVSVAAFHFLNGDSSNLKANEQSKRSLRLKPVERIEWAPHLSFTEELVEMREPVILTNTVVSTWSAIKNWSNRTYLSNHPDLQTMDDVKIGRSNTFTFKDKKTQLALIVESLPKLDVKTNFRLENFTGSQFFSKLEDPNNQDYMYWYGRVGSKLKEDVEPNDFIWKNEKDKNSFGLFMWLSNDDVRPPVHYDMDHNFYVHLAGRKRFVLFPPWEWPKMSPFPRTHPSWHKSQCNFDDPDPSICPDFYEAEAREAILEPGEMMYIPPYWWHHVQSVTGSVSLASWSDSGVTRAMRAMWIRKLFFESIQNPREKIAAMNHYIDQLFENQYGEKAMERKKLIETRWNPLSDIFSHVQSFLTEEECGKEFVPSPELKQAMKDDLDHVNFKLEDCQGAEWNTKMRDIGAIRDLELMDYVETIASEVVGPQHFFNWMKTCLLRDGKRAKEKKEDL